MEARRETGAKAASPFSLASLLFESSFAQSGVGDRTDTEQCSLCAFSFAQSGVKHTVKMEPRLLSGVGDRADAERAAGGAQSGVKYRVANEPRLISGPWSSGVEERAAGGAVVPPGALGERTKVWL